jgi:hypothetical protein
MPTSCERHATVGAGTLAESGLLAWGGRPKPSHNRTYACSKRHPIRRPWQVPQLSEGGWCRLSRAHLALDRDIAAHHLTEAFTVSSVMAGSMGSHQPWAHSERSGIRVQSKLTSNTFAAPSNVISPRVKFAPPA